jgi:hypothetical protein
MTFEIETQDRAPDEGLPPLRWCPYCGFTMVKLHKSVPRCMRCRAVFFVQFSRYMRAARKP